MTHMIRNLTAVAALAFLLAACGMGERIANIGKAPDLQPRGEHPTAERPGTLALPQRVPESLETEQGSLWRTGAKAFFRDHRANGVGDIVTVVINIEDQAQVNNQTVRSRASTEDANLTNFLGFEGKLANILPDGVDPSSLTNFGSNSTNTGSGSVDRAETIDLTVAAIVTHILPNGNMVIQGRQEVRVNFEVRELWITGIIRPEDITATNTVQHTQIAEARISYGGRGQLTDVQQARYGQQLFDILFPF